MVSLVTPELFDGQIVLAHVALEAAAHFTLAAQLGLALQQAGLFIYSHSSSTQSDPCSPTVSCLPSVSSEEPKLGITLLCQHRGLPMTKIPCSK
jgi:hypothetical protein